MDLNEDSLKMITALADAFGPSGFEHDAVKTAKTFAEGFDLREDNIRNLFISSRVNTGDKTLPTVMLDAHLDEVGMMIHSIKPDGTLKFVSLGSLAAASLPSTKVLIKNSEGKLIPGVISAVPPHYLKPGEKQATDIAHLVIDIGAADAYEAKNSFKIDIANPVMFDVSCEVDAEHGLIFGKAFDCRIGCAALIETMRRLEKEKLDVCISGVLSSQEEVGGRGVKVALNSIKPDIAICFEGCPADDTLVEPYAQQTKLKHGPMLRNVDVCMITNPAFQRLALKTAEDKNIKVQSGVREGGGTNGGLIHTYGEGVPTIVIGIPVRYIHCPNCVMAYEDFESSVELAVELIKSLNADVIASF